MSTHPSRHLDIGCGTQPRNPYGRDELYGIDIRAGLKIDGVVEIAAANLSLAPIPFADVYFDSVSAYDFFEHVPRVSLDHERGTSRFPFIELMNEIWRVLKPGGLLYAVTPAYPHRLAFSDPTHVNYIDDRTLGYFCGDQPMGAMYGFKHRFAVRRQKRLHPRGDIHPEQPSATLRLKAIADSVMRRRSHLAWELVKS